MASAGRWLAILLLAAAATADDIATLAADLSTERARDAADRLAELGPAAKEAVPELTKALESDDPELRWRAAWALSRMGKAAAPAAAALIPAAQRDDGLPAAAACIALKRMGGAATDTVLACMREAPEDERPSYLDLLEIVERKPAETIPVLTPLLAHPDGIVRASVCDILASMGRGAAPAARAVLEQVKADPVFGYAAEDVLLAIGEPAVDPLRDLAMDRDATPEVRADAIGLLIKIGGRGIEAAKMCLTEVKDNEVRETVLQSLPEAGPSATEFLPLIEEWITNGEETPSGTARALLAMGPATDAVVERMLLKKELGERIILAANLSGEPRAGPWLLRLADASEPPAVRITALAALARTPLDADASKRALALAEESLTSNPVIACDLAGSQGARGALLAPRIKPLLGSARPDVRAAAAAALLRMGTGGAEEATILVNTLEDAKTAGDVELTRTARQYLASAGAAAASQYEFLLRDLDDPDPGTTYDAAGGLMRMLPALGERRKRVIEALNAARVSPLHDIASIDDVPTLIDLLASGRAASAAADRLVALGAVAWDPLVRSLEAEDDSARTRAAEVLLRIDMSRAEPNVWLIALGGLACDAVRDACLAHKEVAVPRLMGTLLCEVPEARANAAYLLGELAYPMATPVLKRLTQTDPDEWVRYQALWALDTLLPAP